MVPKPRWSHIDVSIVTPLDPFSMLASKERVANTFVMVPKPQYSHIDQIRFPCWHLGNAETFRLISHGTKAAMKPLCCIRSDSSKSVILAGHRHGDVSNVAPLILTPCWDQRSGVSNFTPVLPVSLCGSLREYIYIYISSGIEIVLFRGIHEDS